jgi:hypothetical protein
VTRDGIRPRACLRAAACAWILAALLSAGCTRAEIRTEQSAQSSPPPSVHPPRGSAIPVTRMPNLVLFLEEPGVMVVRTDAEWRELWRRYSYEQRVPERHFETDFSREMVAVVSMGTYVNCDEYGRFVQRIEQAADTLFVAVHHRADRSHILCDYQSAPVDLVRLPRTGGPVRFVPHQAGFVVPGSGPWLEPNGTP